MNNASRGRLLVHILLAFVAINGTGGRAAFAKNEAGDSRADEIKAVFMYKFTGYITWPDDAAENFTIAVLGGDEMLEPLKRIASKKMVASKKLVIKKCANVDEISGAQIVFIPESMNDTLDAIVRKAEAERILTVGSTPGFMEKGVAVNFCPIEDRIGFEMNLSALKRAGLSVSSQLLKIACRVQQDEKAAPEGESK